MNGNQIKKRAGLPHHLTALFMAEADKESNAAQELITLLSQMALGPDVALAAEATASLYGRIILPLCDDFSSASVQVANSVLLTMIDTFCRTSQGQEARQILADLHLPERAALLTRYRALSKNRPLSPAQRGVVKKVFILSRVSLGADIAITSPLIGRTQKAWPEAEIILVGLDHLRHLFYHDGLRYLEFSYNREGGFLEKMTAWPRLFCLIARETAALGPEEFLLFDPDSRLSQLGLLPLAPLSATHYLCSRQDQKEQVRLSAITQAWLDRILPDIPPTAPYFQIQPHLFAACRSFCRQLPPTTLKIIINFGVGHDEKKRLADPFEEELLSRLLETKNTLIILDSGKGEIEEGMAKRLMAKIEEKGYNTAELSDQELAEAEIAVAHGLLRFSGRIDAMAGLISNSDLFIGYDSCGQHVATATKTPAIICFTGAPNKRFLARWQPANHHGKTTTFIIDQQPLSPRQRAGLIEKIAQRADGYRT